MTTGLKCTSHSNRKKDNAKMFKLLNNCTHFTKWCHAQNSPNWSVYMNYVPASSSWDESKGARDQTQHLLDHRKPEASSEKTSISHFTDYAVSLDCGSATNCRKILLRGQYPSTLIASWRNSRSSGSRS